MVQVYLPMGYPLQTGSVYSNVIYQGNVVRLYSIPTDPRSDAQLQNRRFLSDVTKVKKNLGLFAKGACRAVMGASWGTVIYQIIKADIENYWSEALAEWDTFGATNKDAWRLASPYQATFNDVGEIYFGLTRVVARSLFFYSGSYWGSSLWTETQSAAAAAWWAKDLTNVLIKGINFDDHPGIDYHGGWYRVFDANAYGSYYVKEDTGASEQLDFYFKGKTFGFYFAKGSGYGGVKITIDGVDVATISQNLSSTLWQVVEYLSASFSGLHHVKMQRVSGLAVNLNYIKVL